LIILRLIFAGHILLTILLTTLSNKHRYHTNNLNKKIKQAYYTDLNMIC